MSEFDVYFDKNPRELIPDSLKEFLQFAEAKYKDLDCVNMTYSDDVEEQLEEVKRYIGDSAEALLLYKEFLASKKGVLL